MTHRVPPIRTQDIHSLTEFLRNHRAAVERLRESGRPEVLTVHGKAALVVQDARRYQEVLELAERMQALLAERAGHERNLDGGELSPGSDGEDRTR